MTEEVVLVADGVARFCIEARPSQDAEAFFPALDELISHLSLCLKADVPWYDRRSDANPPVRLAVQLAPGQGLDGEAIEIAASPGEVVLRGGTPQAVCNAVYTFLDAAFGVRWLWPGETGTVTPRAREVRWPVGLTRHTPDWAWRRLWIGGAFWREDDATLAELKAGVSPGALRQLHCWRRRNRLGGLNISDGHRWGQICSPLVYGETHPEYFALVNGVRDTAYHDGKHGNQPCTSNPDVVRLAADDIVARFRACPELDGFSMAVNDGGGFCECDSCRAGDSDDAGDARDDAFDAVTNEAAPGHATGARIITDRMLAFANRVAERVVEVCPDKLLLFLIYGPYRNPPRRTRLHPNVIAQFCAMSWSHASPETCDRDMEALRLLGGHAERLGVYDYFVNGKNGGIPRGFARTFHRSLRQYHERGCRYFATQAGLDFAGNGLAYYVAARALWDGEDPFEDILDDYCGSGFGPAAPHVKRYLTAFLDRWEMTEGGRTLGASTMEALAPQLYDGAW